MKDWELKKKLLSSPGDTIKEHIEYIGMSQCVLAFRMDISIKKVNSLIEGKEPLTHIIAEKLEYILEIPKSLWINLEKTYRKELLEIKTLSKK